jgi:hypothetical protein
MVVFGAACVVGLMVSASTLGAPSTSSSVPSWWAKYEALQQHAGGTGLGSAPSQPGGIGPNVDVSNEDGAQSEVSITLNPSHPSVLVAGSNEVFRNPMRGYFSSDGGATWGGVDLPLPPPVSTNGSDYGSDPGVAFDTQGNVYYSYIVVFTNRSSTGIQGTEVAVAKSFDAGRTWPQVTYFNFNNGAGKFNDKSLIAVDTNPASPFRDTVYVAWDIGSANNGKSSSNNALVVARSTDGGHTFSAPTALTAPNQGPSSVIAADPFVGPNGEVYVAWNDSQHNRLMLTGSRDGGATFGRSTVIAPTAVGLQDAIPAMASRSALLYPACDVDRSPSSYRGTLYCSWMDEAPGNGTDILVARSLDAGNSWSAPVRVNDDPPGMREDQFNQWLSVDPTSGAVDLSWNDARNDPSDTKTDVYFSSSADGGLSFSPNRKVTTAPSDESAANPAADQRDQYGDYEGIVAYGGTAHPIWTDGRLDGSLDPATGQPVGEEIFTATIG